MSFAHCRCGNSKPAGRGRRLCEDCRADRIAAGGQSAWWRQQNKERSLQLNRESNRRQYTQARLAAIAAYDGACECCGEDDPHFLQLDHRNEVIPDHHRRKNGSRITGQALLILLKREGYPDYMRLLCGNCNFARGHYGFCPHEEHDARQRRYAI